MFWPECGHHGHCPCRHWTYVEYSKYPGVEYRYEAGKELCRPATVILYSYAYYLRRYVNLIDRDQSFCILTSDGRHNEGNKMRLISRDPHTMIYDHRRSGRITLRPILDEVICPLRIPPPIISDSVDSNLPVSAKNVVELCIFEYYSECNCIQNSE